MANFLTTVMTNHGYLALIILAFIEACCIPISSEITFAFAGAIAGGAFAVSAHHKFSLIAVIVIGTLAELAGSTTAYAVGRRGGLTLLDRYGRWVLVSHSDLDRAERFFANRGSWAVAVARALPIVRCFAGFGAGTVEVPLVQFSIFNLIGTAAWATGLSLLGYQVGDTVTKLYNSFSVIGIILVVLLIGGLIAHRVHAIRRHAHHPGSDHPGGAANTEDRPRRVGGGAHRGGRSGPPSGG